MSQTQKAVWCESLKLVPAKWRGEFCRFVEEGEASDEFLAFLQQDVDCRRACEIVFRSDEELGRIIKAAESNDVSFESQLSIPTAV